jgi:hypothetical protein
MQYTVNELSLYGDLLPRGAVSAKARGYVQTGEGSAVPRALATSEDLVPIYLVPPHLVPPHLAPLYLAPIYDGERLTALRLPIHFSL